jgi:hypothetical protein
MRLRFLGALGISLSLVAMPAQMPAQAQVTEAQVGRVVEALRQASKPETSSPSLYSDWQVKPENITRWSKSCTGREVTPSQFQANPATARSIVTCVIRDVLKQEYQASRNNEALAVQRVAAWWMTGDSNRYNSADISPYVKKVVSSFNQLSGSQVTQSTPTPTSTTQPQPTSTAASTAGAFYDRYMRAAYAAVQKKDSSTALLYFKRALDERPQDKFATQAIRNLEASSKPKQTAAPVKR